MTHTSIVIQDLEKSAAIELTDLSVDELSDVKGGILCIVLAGVAVGFAVEILT